MYNEVPDTAWLVEEEVRRYDLESRLVSYAVLIIDVVESLPNTRAANDLAGQLVRSGTSPALNYGEVQSAESRNDFIHKMKIALKEVKETRVNLKIIQQRPFLTHSSALVSALSETEQLIAILGKSVATASNNQKNESRSHSK
jgi:four helix bundle protein